MDIHRQQCQSCVTSEVRNILVREANLPTIVYVRCVHCGRLVARYELSDYYHHGKGIESFLSSRRGRVEDSGREMMKQYDEAKRKAIEGFKEVVTRLEELGKDG
jgi:uncharacterized Zn finger protein